MTKSLHEIGAKSEMSSVPHVHTSPNGFSWHVIFPGATSSSLQINKPKAKLVLSDDETDFILIPISVGRALNANSDNKPQNKNQLLTLLNKTSEKCAWTRVISMASRREYSSQEVQDRLLRDGYSSSCINAIVSLAIEKSIINDKRFADTFIRSKNALGWGSIRIERELKHRGITICDFEGWPDEYFTDTSQLDCARNVIASKRIPDKNAFQKLVRYLISKGYTLDIAKQVVREYLSQE